MTAHIYCTFVLNNISYHDSKTSDFSLADGKTYEGLSVGANGDSIGELVFNTSMTGYQEMLTESSYARQIITWTTAHVGNRLPNAEDMESNKIWAAGLVMRDCSILASNYHFRTIPD